MIARLLRPAALAAIGALTLVAACDKTPQAEPDNPAAFKVRLAVEPAADGQVQRVVLPAQALIALQRHDLGDVRIFDGRGKPLALALDGLGTAHGEATRDIQLPAIPVMGTPAGEGAEMSITIDHAKVGHVVVRGQDGATHGEQQVVAALLDTRAIAEPAIALTLDADLPLQQPVNVSLEESTDLASWQPIAEKVLFRAGGGALLGSPRITLGGIDLRQHYVRLRWDQAAGVTIRGASITTTPTAPLPRVSVLSSGLQLENAHRARFSVGFATPIAALRLTQTSPDGIVPVRVYGRDRTDQQWTLLAAGIVRQGSAGSLIDLGGAALRHYRIEADARGAGFTLPPKLELLFDPVELIAAFNGAPPYVLAVGAAQAQPAYFSSGEVAPEELLKAGPLPLAKVDISGTPAPAITVQPPTEGPFEPRKAALWAVLLLGTAILGFAAIRLLRANAAAGDDQTGS